MVKKKVIITGSEGIVGSAVCSHLSSLYDLDKISLRFGQDLTDENFVKKYFKETKAEYLVNCFGFNDHIDANKENESLFDVNLDSMNKYLSLNIVSLFSVCREFARNEVAKGIVNISSIYGMVSPLPSLYDNTEKHIGYSVSKGAVIQLTRHLAVHLAPKIRINCIVLGGILDKQSDEFKEKYSELTPLKRMMNRSEIGGLIEYLCSDKSTYMTGAIIPLDGGWTAR